MNQSQPEVSFRFIGNKASLLEPIVQSVVEVADLNSSPHVADPFSGTGSVSLALAKAGFSVTASDLLLSCVIHARAQLLPKPPLQFGDLVEQKSIETLRKPNLFADDRPYHKVISLLNSLSGEEGFFYQEYCCDGCPENGAEPRNYFSPQNARKIDAIRSRIREWNEKELLTEIEHSVLLHDLMLATNAIANTTGTYGYFLSELTESARQPLELQPTQFTPTDGSHRVRRGRARKVLSTVSTDIAYLDPPYNKRQYAAYYHILETIAHEDEPQLIGKSGLRPWQDRSSDFCYKDRVPDALKRVIRSTQANYVFLSYSEDGHICHNRIKKILSEFGNVEYIELGKDRYSSHSSNKPEKLKERLYKVNTF